MDRPPLEYRALHAPPEDRSALIDPPLAEAGHLLTANLRQRQTWHGDFQGRSLALVTRQARRELLARARRWTAAYRDVDLASVDPLDPIVLAGHQPELFHPGVWFKNFALGTIASEHRAAAINLVIDSDSVKQAGLRVPGGNLKSPRVETVPLDRPGPRVPYEDRPILDCQVFADFGRRAAERLSPLVADPLVRRFWPMVLARCQYGHNLGTCIAQARHQLEGEWGLQTLEIPQSKVCDSEAFTWFMVHLLAHLPRFVETYNAAVHEYRHVYGIRNAAHPVPDLAAEGPWLEAPLWVWTAEDPQRRRLFARVSGRETILSDRANWELRLPLGPEADGQRAVEKLVESGRHGVKIRSRALVTTLWARLVLGDLFLHGIGGAKYDQVTDLLIQRFFGLTPPSMMVVSATLCLPIGRPSATAGQLRAVTRQLRDLTWQPERFLEDHPPAEAEELAAAKRRWIATPVTPRIAHERWRTLRQLSEDLQPWVARRRQELLDQQAATTQALRAERILGSREYGFCLYPEPTLRKFLDDLLPKNR